MGYRRNEVTKILQSQKMLFSLNMEPKFNEVPIFFHGLCYKTTSETDNSIKRSKMQKGIHQKKDIDTCNE